MTKRVLSPIEADDLRQALQFAVLDALASSRRWQPNELAFQGGTCLHMVHASPRFSEDLDFMVRQSVDLGKVTTALRRRLLATSEGSPWFAKDLKLTFKDAKAANNPHAFEVQLHGDQVLGKVRVKVELFVSPASAMDAINVVVSPVTASRGPLAGSRATIPALDLHEIYYDKVFAVGARPYLKPRDIFDLWWLQQHPKCGRIPIPAAAMRTRCELYKELSIDQWRQRAADRMAAFQTEAAQKQIGLDLAQWLPEYFGLVNGQVNEMITASATALTDGMATMAALEEPALEAETDSPAP